MVQIEKPGTETQSIYIFIHGRTRIIIRIIIIIRLVRFIFNRTPHTPVYKHRPRAGALFPRNERASRTIRPTDRPTADRPEQSDRPTDPNDPTDPTDRSSRKSAAIPRRAFHYGRPAGGQPGNPRRVEFPPTGPFIPLYFLRVFLFFFFIIIFISRQTVMHLHVRVRGTTWPRLFLGVPDTTRKFHHHPSPPGRGLPTAVPRTTTQYNGFCTRYYTIGLTLANVFS